MEIKKIIPAKLSPLPVKEYCSDSLQFFPDEIETRAVSQVLEYLNSEGGTWPTLDSDWDEINFDLELSMAAAQRQNSRKDFGSGPIITMWVMKDYVGLDFIITVSTILNTNYCIPQKMHYVQAMLSQRN